MLIDGFSLGFLATASFVVAMFFLRFWVRTRDFLFLAFAIAFAFEAISRTAMVFMNHPDSSSWIYIVRLCTYLLLMGAILRKNRRAR
jgi:uncharacterized membrane protein HdeD (DUF308 family)